MKRALITGIRGQDGAYLARLLLSAGYQVIGADRRNGEGSNWRLNELGCADDVHMVYMDLLELTNIIRTLEKYRPDEVYNLAAQSFVATSFDQPLLTSDVNAMGVMRLLEAIRLVNPEIRFYQASTSEMFGRVREVPQTEETPFHPRSPYGVAKLYAHWATVNYREAYDLYACSGILFNHESPLRGLEFVTRKITRAVAEIQAGIRETVVLGNINAKRDWGHAEDYVAGMYLMMQQQQADDFLLATGESRSVREFIEAAFKAVDIEISWQGDGLDEIGICRKSGKTRVTISPDFYRPAEVDVLLGSAAKALSQLGWKPQISFSELVQMMVEADIRRFCG